MSFKFNLCVSLLEDFRELKGNENLCLNSKFAHFNFDINFQNFEMNLWISAYTVFFFIIGFLWVKSRTGIYA